MHALDLAVPSTPVAAVPLSCQSRESREMYNTISISIGEVLIQVTPNVSDEYLFNSIIETAKANELNTYQYLELLLTELPKHTKDTNLSFIEDLLPWSDRVQKECPSKYKNLNFS